MRSQQSSESSQQGAVPPGGVPGALSNQPPVNPVAPITVPAASPAQAAANGQAAAAAAPRPGAAGNSRKDVTTNYELDRSIRHVQQGAGGIKRLSVAVVVNHRGARDAQGKPVIKALTDPEMDQVRNLVKEAMGFSTQRGDSLNVVNSQFASAADDRPVSPWWRDPENIALAKPIGGYLALGLIALFLWFGVLRPLLRKHLAPPAPPPVAEVNDEAQVDAAAEAAQRETDIYRNNLHHVQETARKDPRLVATVLRNWMQDHE
jgi:flagellar M-ring protein FliF